MGIVSAMYAGVSGIKSFSAAIQVVGSNLANLNTIGYKSNRTQFGDLLSQNLTGAITGNQLGRGVHVSSISKVMAQGTLSTTDVNTDVAVSGVGWFQVVKGSEKYYTRDGQFHVNENGQLVNSVGYSVVGFQYDNLGNPTSETGTVDLTDLITNPHATESLYIKANLDSQSTGFDPAVTAWDPQNPSATSNFSTSIRIYDSLGKDHEVTVFFRKREAGTGVPAAGPNDWEWHAMVPGSEVGSANEWFEGGSGTLTFTSAGALDTETVITAPSFSFTGGAAANQAVTLDFGDSLTTDGGTGLSGTTQFASPNAVSYQEQDGFSAGNLVSIAISGEGVITGLFSNGRTRDIAQLALARFPSEYGLASVGDNMFAESPSSGMPTLLAPGSGGVGSITANALELSNVDVANEFVAMIQYQRAYQANTRVVSVGDQLLNDTVNLIR